MNKIFPLLMLLIFLPILELFSKPDDVIRIKAIRQASNTPPESFAGMNVKDGRFWDKIYPAVNGIPDSLTNVKTYFLGIDNVQALYQASCAGMVERKDFNYYIKAWGADTTGNGNSKIPERRVLYSP